VPVSCLWSFAGTRGEVRGVRVGRFAQDPPITRVVLDLKAPQPYQLFPSGKSVIVKVGDGASAQPMVPTPRPIISAVIAHPAHAITPVSYAPIRTPLPSKPAPRLNVNFQNGRLTIWANKATLAEVLSEIHHQTGAEIPIPADAGQDQVIANLGPGPSRAVITPLLNGSRFNFI